MPPAMTSVRGGPTRSSSASGSMGGNVPRREPLRRLYPLHRSRTASDSIREVSNFGDENMPTSGMSVNMVENAKDLSNQSAGSSAKRRAQKLMFTAGGGGGTGGVQRNTPVPRTQSVPEYNTNKVSQRFGSAERSGSAERAPTYSRPSLIRRSSDVGSVSSYGPSYSVRTDSSSGRRSGSILKRPSSSRSSTSSSISSHRGRADSNSVSINHKQVQFCPNVSVVQMDEDGEHLSTHFQELNGEKRKRMGTLSRNQLSRNYDNVIYITDDALGLQDINSKASHDQRRSSNEHQMSSQLQSQLARDGRFRDLFTRLNNSSGTLRSVSDQGEESGPLKKGQFDITFSNRPGEPTKLRFVLHMGQDYNPNDLVVKANTTGSRIRVLATRTDRNSRQTEEYNEKYMLPMDIDPYAIEARLDKWGNLTVEAPLLTMEKRPELNKSNSVLCAIYV